MAHIFTSFPSFKNNQADKPDAAEKVYFSFTEMVEMQKIDQRILMEQRVPSETSLRIIREHSIRRSSLLTAD